MSQGLSLSVASLRAAYPNANLPVETVAVYVAALDDLEPGDVAAAVAKIIKTSRFFPTVAEIREAVGETRLNLPSPAEAWMIACGQMEPQGDGDLVRKAKKAVGGEWAFRTSENPTALRSQFLRIYEDLRDRQVGSFVETGRLQLAPGDDPAAGLPVKVALRGMPGVA